MARPGGVDFRDECGGEQVLRTNLLWFTSERPVLIADWLSAIRGKETGGEGKLALGGNELISEDRG